MPEFTVDQFEIDDWTFSRFPEYVVIEGPADPDPTGRLRVRLSIPTDVWRRAGARLVSLREAMETAHDMHRVVP